MTDQPPPGPRRPNRLAAMNPPPAGMSPLFRAGRLVPATAASAARAAVPTRRLRRPPVDTPPPPPGPAVRALPTESYTPWLTRVMALIIDYLPYRRRAGHRHRDHVRHPDSRHCVTDITQYDVSQYCASQPSTIGQLVQWLATLVGLGLLDLELRLPPGHHRFEPRQVGDEDQGGQRDHRTADRFRVVRRAPPRPLRRRDHLPASVSCFRCWDAKRQTLADKIMTTVVLPIGLLRVRRRDRASLTRLIVDERKP